MFRKNKNITNNICIKSSSSIHCDKLGKFYYNSSCVSECPNGVLRPSGDLMNKMEKIADGFEAVFGDKDVHIEYPQYDSSLFNEQESAKVLNNLLKYNQFNVSAWSKLVKTDILKSNEIQFEKGLLNEDFDWTFKMWPNLRKISFCNDSVYLYRMREGSITKTFGYKNAADYCWIVEHWMNYWLNSNDANRDIYLGYVANIYVTIIYFYFFLTSNSRKLLKQRILNLSSVLIYSKFVKGQRLRTLQKCFGNQMMLLIGGAIGYLRKTK